MRHLLPVALAVLLIAAGDPNAAPEPALPVPGDRFVIDLTAALKRYHEAGNEGLLFQGAVGSIRSVAA